MILQCRGHSVNLSAPVVMGVLNVTPDSFSDGGAFLDPGRAVEQAHRMVAAGAAIVDVGGESTRPGAQAVEASEECQRILPVVRRLASELQAPISVDTSKPEVMLAAVEAGAGMLNDVRALREPGALRAAAECAVPVCLMHMQGEPRTMQARPHYGDVVEEVRDFLAQRLAACREAGIPSERLLADPGFGFGKSLAHNLRLAANLGKFAVLKVPILVGVSRKSIIGTLLDKPVTERLAGSVALATLAAWQGADIVRAHDVAETADALRVCTAVLAARN